MNNTAPFGRGSVWKLAFWLVSAGSILSQPDSIRIRVLDEHGRPAVTRIVIRDSSGAARRVDSPETPAPTVVHPRFPELGIVMRDSVRIVRPSGSARLGVERGPEYLSEYVDIGAAGPSQHTVKLRRWISMARDGWWSGDTHVHRVPAEMPLLMDAADLHFAPTITRWNSNRSVDDWPPTPFYAAGPDRWYSIDNSEDERDWGAALFLGLKTPIDLYPAKAQYPLPEATWRAAREHGAFIDQEKVIWWAAPVMAALIPPDAIGVALNHFVEEKVEAYEAWGRPRDQAKYRGPQGFTQYIFDLYSLYLSAGFRVPASAGSANGVMRNPIGYNRSYVHLGNKFTPESWLEGQKAGRNFVTNGPMLFATVNGKLPGSIHKPGKVEVKVSVQSSAELEKAEVVVDGVVAASFAPSSNRSRMEASAPVVLSEGSWLTVRVWERNPKTVRFAHTSPFYAGAAAKRDPKALAFFREWIDLFIERIKAFPDSQITSAQREEYLALCRKALERYR